ncbi:MAG: CDP-diacylglycerol--glycerol-3-phosphate 3-phosphatidyltransferase, partial [Pseudomonadota bacterium]
VLTGLMVILANAYPTGLAPYAMPMLVIPAAMIATREVLVSGLREYLGDVKLDVTTLAKWKTTVQLLAVGAGLLMGPFEYAANKIAFRSIATPDETVVFGPQEAFLLQLYPYAALLAVALLWLAALLTVITGWDYFRKGLAYIREKEAR